MAPFYKRFSLARLEAPFYKRFSLARLKAPFYKCFSLARLKARLYKRFSLARLKLRRLFKTADVLKLNYFLHAICFNYCSQDHNVKQIVCSVQSNIGKSFKP